nr:T9SS type A sorting domain-containing protein [Gammaproteobacteria bacterium]NIX02580.1 T9SS type A sorting domain-containing protein [Phycisphaerae bacterium]
EQASGVTETLTDVEFVDLNHGWITGLNGTILRTTEDGNSAWAQVTTNTNVDLNAVDFVDQKHGWAVGNNGVILYSSDGGWTWEQLNFPDEDIAIRDVAFVDTLTGWAVGHIGYDGMIYYTNDGGITWVKQFEETQRLYISIEFLNPQQGWVLAPLRTKDGGKNWLSAGHVFLVNDIAPVSFDTVWAVGRRGKILRTTNGGQGWQELSFGGELVPDVELHSVYFIDEQRGWIVGRLGTIVHTSDGGESWQVQRQRLSWDTSKGAFRNATEGWLIRWKWPNSSLWRTYDGGQTWQLEHGEEEGVIYRDIRFLDSQLGWLYGDDDNRTFINRTQDGGASWQTIWLPDSLFNPLTFFFLNDSTLYLSKGKDIYRSADVGMTWQLARIDSTVAPYIANIRDFSFVDDKYGWAVGDNQRVTDSGFMISTKDGGESWQSVYPVSGAFFHISMIDRQRGFVVVSSAFEASLFRTDDGWQNFHFVWGDIDLNDIYFLDENEGWFSGNFGTLLHTTDGGRTVIEVETDVKSDLHRINFVENGKIGYVFGEDNTLLKYDVRSTSIDDEEPNPQQFNLRQNYPNPFNSETILPLQLTQPGEVQITIYNILGEEVIKLHHGPLTAGSHELRWQGKDARGVTVPSGLYFCRIRVRSGAERMEKTIKMLLLR